MTTVTPFPQYATQWLSTETATLFNQIISNSVLDGLTPSAGTGFTLDIAAGDARINGYWVNQASATTATMNASATNYVFLQLILNANSQVTGQQYVVNTTGTNPGNAILLATVTTSGTAITLVTDSRGILGVSYNAGFLNGSLNLNGQNILNVAIETINRYITLTTSTAADQTAFYNSSYVTEWSNGVAFPFVFHQYGVQGAGKYNPVLLLQSDQSNGAAQVLAFRAALDEALIVAYDTGSWGGHLAFWTAPSTGTSPGGTAVERIKIHDVGNIELEANAFLYWTGDAVPSSSLTGIGADGSGGNLILNAPTGKSIFGYINGAQVLGLSASTLSLAASLTTISLGAATTIAAAGLTLASTTPLTANGLITANAALEQITAAGQAIALGTTYATAGASQLNSPSQYFYGTAYTNITGTLGVIGWQVQNLLTGGSATVASLSYLQFLSPYINSVIQNFQILPNAVPSAAGTFNSPNFILSGYGYNTASHEVDWQEYVAVTSQAGASTRHIQSRIGTASFADRMTISDGGVITSGASWAFGTDNIVAPEFGSSFYHINTLQTQPSAAAGWGLFGNSTSNGIDLITGGPFRIIPANGSSYPAAVFSVAVGGTLQLLAEQSFSAAGTISATAGSLVRATGTTSSYTLTLPSAPAIGTLIYVSAQAGGTSTTTVAAGGTDAIAFNGSSVASVALGNNHGAVFVYTPTLWMCVAT